MPNIFTCSVPWFEELKAKEEKVVVAVWKEGDEKTNAWLERLQDLERQRIPVYVIDAESCPDVAQKLQAKSGETIVFRRGVEKGRLIPTVDIEGNMEKVKHMTEG